MGRGTLPSPAKFLLHKSHRMAEETSTVVKEDPLKWVRLAACVVVGLALWYWPTPSGLSLEAWHVFAVFAATIVSFLLRPLPMGLCVLIGLLVLSGTGTTATSALDDWLEDRGLNEESLSYLSRSEAQPETLVEYSPSYNETIKIRETITDKTFKEKVQQSLSAMLRGFGDTTVWLVVAAFFISGGMLESGLGRRVALMMVAKLGKTTLGLGYAIAAAELLLAPFIPSNTARGGGLMMPIVNAINGVLGSDARESPRRAGEYLVLCGAHLNLVTAAMFLTGMAANPLVSKAADDILNVNFDWGMWIKGSIVPGLASLALIPWALYRITKPELTDAHEAQDAIRGELKDMGDWTYEQVTMAGILLVMLVLWATGAVQEWLLGAKLHTTWVAICGVVALVICKVLPYDKLTGNSAAWDTLLWLGGLIAMADALKSTHFVDWFANQVKSSIGDTTGVLAAIILALVYFYSMYAFSMLTGHILAFAGVFFSAAIAVEAPPLLMVALIAYFSNLCGCTTNYSTGPVVIYYGLGYVPIKRWFWIGFLVSLMHLSVWLVLGLMWWKLLGWW